MILTDKIAQDVAAGMHDDSLTQLLEAAKIRTQELREARKTTDFGVGDVVRFNDYCATKYLRGHHAIVTGFRGKRLLVKLKNPIGRHAKIVDGKWEGTEVAVPPSIIDLVQ